LIGPWSSLKIYENFRELLKTCVAWFGDCTTAGRTWFSLGRGFTMWTRKKTVRIEVEHTHLRISHLPPAIPEAITVPAVDGLAHGEINLTLPETPYLLTDKEDDR
jgi:hypothetical protein